MPIESYPGARARPESLSVRCVGGGVVREDFDVRIGAKVRGRELVAGGLVQQATQDLIRGGSSGEKAGASDLHVLGAREYTVFYLEVAAEDSLARPVRARMNPKAKR